MTTDIIGRVIEVRPALPMANPADIKYTESQFIEVVIAAAPTPSTITENPRTRAAFKKLESPGCGGMRLTQGNNANNRDGGWHSEMG